MTENQSAPDMDRYSSLGELLREHPGADAGEALAGMDESARRAARNAAVNMNGNLVFRGTGVTVSALFRQLEAGRSFSDFLWDFPQVGKEQAYAALQAAQRLLEVRAYLGEDGPAARNGEDPDGPPVIRGFLIPVYTLFDDLLRGDTAREFIFRFHGPGRPEIQDVLREAYLAFAQAAQEETQEEAQEETQEKA